MNEPLDELYFQRLYELVANPKTRNPSKTYWKLLGQLFRKEFVWFIPNDDNRIADGLELRDEFLAYEGIDDVDPAWMNLGCSFLELLIGLSRRLSFFAEGEPDSWFWTLIENLGLEKFNDHYGVPTDVVDETLDRVIFRTYDARGRGGLFPLERAPKDQRQVELWYQMHTYIMEQDEEGRLGGLL